MNYDAALEIADQTLRLIAPHCYGKPVPVREERDLFELIGVPIVDPTKREVK